MIYKKKLPGGLDGLHFVRSEARGVAIGEQTIQPSDHLRLLDKRLFEGGAGKLDKLALHKLWAACNGPHISKLMEHHQNQKENQNCTELELIKNRNLLNQNCQEMANKFIIDEKVLYIIDVWSMVAKSVIFRVSGLIRWIEKLWKKNINVFIVPVLQVS